MDASSHYRLPSLGTMLQTTEHGRRPFSFSRMNRQLNTNTAAMPPSPPRSESRASDINPNAPIFVPESTYHITRTQPPRPATLARPMPDQMAQTHFRNLSTATNPYPNDIHPSRRAVAGPPAPPPFTSTRRTHGHLRTDTNPFPNDPRPFQRESTAPSTITGYTRTRQSEARLSTNTTPYPHDPRPFSTNITGPDGRTRTTRDRQSSAHMSTDTNPYHGVPPRFDPAIIAELDRRVAEAQARRGP
ncbi:hypothetical protein PV11_06045 [Exophiala sideris]|uniref:Uncharacterized protein n=1 Tax=Exophiala sideris TaxID=1016849 RepID=A0A0D1X8E2_9EURO|nr:hypothetical protein PV11_06045 [Exophiala sideris]